MILNFLFEALNYSALAAKNMISQFFDYRGFSPVEIGYLTVLLPIISMISNPFWFKIGSKISEKRAFLITAISSAFAFWALYFSNNFIFAMIAIGSFSFFFSSFVPLGDSIMMSTVKKYGGSFDKIRLFGTVGFSSVALLLGMLVEYGFIWFFIITSAALLVSSLIIVFKKDKKIIDRKKRKIEFKRDGKVSIFILMLVGMVFGVSMVSFHNTYFPILSREMGFDKSIVGIVFSFMSITELPFLYFAENIIKKLGNFKVLIIGMFTSALRIFLLTFVSTIIPLLIIESLHGLTYILMYYSIFNYIHFRLPEKYLTKAQSTFWTVSLGVTYIISSIGGGYIMEYFNSIPAFRIMAVLGFSVTGIVLLVYIYYNKKINLNK